MFRHRGLSRRRPPASLSARLRVPLPAGPHPRGNAAGDYGTGVILHATGRRDLFGLGGLSTRQSVEPNHRGLALAPGFRCHHCIDRQRANANSNSPITQTIRLPRMTLTGRATHRPFRLHPVVDAPTAPGRGAPEACLLPRRQPLGLGPRPKSGCAAIAARDSPARTCW